MNESSEVTLRNRATGSWINQDDIKEVQKFEDFTTVDWIEDELKEQNRKSKKAQSLNLTNSLIDKFYSTAHSWLVLTLMGIMIGTIAACLNIITAWLVSIRIGHCSDHFYLTKAFCCWGEESESCKAWVPWSSWGIINYFVFVLLSVLFALISAILVRYYSPAAAGSGISEIKCIISGFVMKGFLGWWTLLIKSVCLPLAIGSGLSVGKEGPSVHYAVCVGNCIAKLFVRYRRSASKAREFLTASAAAGVAVAFGSPMGGVLFSIEEISSIFQLSTMWRSYFCALIATTVLATINPFRTGQLVMFEVSYDKNWHLFEVPFYILLGVFGGVYGIIVSKFNIKVVAFRKKYLSNHAVREVVILAGLTSMFSYFNEFLRLDMTESMEILFHECGTGWNHMSCNLDKNQFPLFASLAFATIARMFLVIITYGCKVPAGIFVPSMAAGATFGRGVGIIVQSLQRSNLDHGYFSACHEDNSCITPGTYAFLGAGAALSGITHLTVTVVVIMFELTGALRYIIPTMIVVSITKSINDKWGKGGIADQMIRFNGLPFIDAKEEHVFNVPTSNAMTKVIVPLFHNMKFNTLEAIVLKTKYTGFPIIENITTKNLNGYISRIELVKLIESLRSTNKITDETVCIFTPTDDSTQIADNVADFSKSVNSSPITVDVSSPLELTLDVFHKLGPRVIMIEDSGSLAGLITRKDILRYEFILNNKDKGNLSNSDTTNYEMDDHIWESMLRVSEFTRRILGKFLHKDENRYIQLRDNN